MWKRLSRDEVSAFVIIAIILATLIPFIFIPMRKPVTPEPECTCPCPCEKQ